MEFLGLVDEPIIHKTDYTINKIGGFPDFIGEGSTKEKCGTCEELLVLLCQFYIPVSSFAGHRSLYIYICLSQNNACKNRIQIFRRLQQLSEQKATGDFSRSNDDWGTSADDWGTSADDWGASTGDCSACADEWCTSVNDLDTTSNNGKTDGELKIGEGKSNPETEDGISGNQEKAEEGLGSKMSSMQLNSPHYKPFYINVIEAPKVGDHDMEDTAAEKLLEEYIQREGVDLSQLESQCAGSTGSKEEYEQSYSDLPQKIFHKFMKSLRRCPEQVVRYCYGGSPVPCRPILSNPPPCEACSAPRQFELQLMPAMLNRLLPVGFSGTRADWCTLLVFTCSANCNGSSASFAYPEYSMLQQEPDSEVYDRFSALT